MDGLVWPPVSDTKATALLAQQFVYQQTESLSSAHLWSYQKLQLGELLQQAVQSVPWYQHQSEYKCVLDRYLMREDWNNLPVIRRSDLQQNFEELINPKVPPNHGVVTRRASSGSTGMPVEVLWSSMFSQLWAAAVLRDHLWHKRQLCGKLCSIRHIKFQINEGALDSFGGVLQDNWGSPLSTVFSTGPAASLSVHEPVDKQVDWLLEHGPAYLQTYPSNLWQILDHIEQIGVTLKNLQAVRTFSEVVDPALRNRCKDVLGVEIEDIYSATEIGYIALQCPQSENYHIQAETMLVEVLDDYGRSCSPGEVGRVVVTPLHNFAMPLIRYEIGDYAEVGENCCCGRGLPVLRTIKGRSRNLLVFPDGRKDWPVFRDTSFRSVAPIRQFRFVQKSTEKIKGYLIVDSPLTSDQEGALRSMILDRLGYPFDLQFTYVDRIPRQANGKYEDFTSELIF